MSREPKTSSPSDFADVVTITRDGLLLRGDGTFVRALRVGAVNPLTIDDADADLLSAGLGAIAARLEPRQSLQFYVVANPVSLADVIDEGRAAGQAAMNEAEAHGEDGRATALGRLTTAAEQSITHHSADIAAMDLAYYVLCPYAPKEDVFGTTPLPGKRSVKLSPRDVERAVNYTAGMAEGVRKDLESIDVPARLLDGYEFAQLIGQRLSGPRFAASELVDAITELDDFSAALQPADSPENTRLRRAIAQTDMDFSHMRRVGVGESIEQVTFMSDIPEGTWLGQPLQLMQISKPFVYSVFVTATDRVRERRRYRNRFKRIRGMNVGKERKGAWVSPDAELQESEAEAVVADLTTTLGSGIYEVSTYIAVRDPFPVDDGDALSECVAAIRREATGSSDARFAEGLFAQRSLFPSTLPIGRDAAGRSKRFVSRNVGDLIPLVGSSCGSPSGAVLGHSSPGRTLERIDPYDPVHENHLLLITGKSGSGKTMGTAITLSRWLARGARGFIIDRAGHYDFLCSLIPGAASVAIGPGDNNVAINPWDVDDVAAPPAAKITFLLDLHSLLIGAHDAGSDSYGLESLEHSVLEGGIRAVYNRCAESGETPSEGMLQETLFQSAENADEIISTAARSLAHRLSKFVGDGTYAYLTDRETNVPTDSPLVAFDTRALPEDMAGAIVLVIAEHIEREVRARREAFLASDDPAASEWSGRAFLAVDEAWAQLQRRVTGRWINEFARRGRHLALTLVAISQHLSDFSGEYGAALRSNATMQLHFRQEADDLRFASECGMFSAAEVDLLASLRTSKREYATAYFVNGSRGRGVVTLRYGDLEYWIGTSDPVNDEPIRRRALREAEGEPWGALRRLSDPKWFFNDEPENVSQAA